MGDTRAASGNAGGGGDHARATRILRWILGFSIVSTGIHYSHNFVEIDSYPQSELIGNGAIQVAIVISWPLFTAAALIGYRWFRQRRFPAAQLALLAYAPAGLITIGHFAEGNPDIPAFFYATIFTDFIAGAAVLWFAFWSLRVERAGGSARRMIA